MKTKDKLVHEPLFHIVKRDALPWWKAWLIRIIAVVAALIVSSIVTVLLTGENPLGVFGTMIDGAIGTERRIWVLLQNVAMLLCVALAVTPAFKMRFWNIGAEGQVLIGGLATAACMLKLGDVLPNALLMPHQGGPTIDRRLAVTRSIIADIRRFLAGQPMSCEISRDYARKMSAY